MIDVGNVWTVAAASIGGLVTAVGAYTALRASRQEKVHSIEIRVGNKYTKIELNSARSQEIQALLSNLIEHGEAHIEEHEDGDPD
jgi:hypothetical protein